MMIGAHSYLSGMLQCTFGLFLFDEKSNKYCPFFVGGQHCLFLAFLVTHFLPLYHESSRVENIVHFWDESTNSFDPVIPPNLCRLRADRQVELNSPKDAQRSIARFGVSTIGSAHSTSARLVNSSESHICSFCPFKLFWMPVLALKGPMHRNLPSSQNSDPIFKVLIRL